MKKIFLALMLCSFVLVTGCEKKDEAKVPKSVIIYQQLELTADQNKKLTDIRATQRAKIDNIRKDLEKQRKTLIDADAIKSLTEDQKKENYEKYRTASNEMRDKLTAARAEYDVAFMDILDDNQRKIYKKYLNQREKEKEQRVKDAKKQAVK